MSKPVKNSKNRPRKKRAFSSGLTGGQVSGGYSGGQANRQNNWLISGLSADAEIRTHLFLLRNRCRDLERNNDYARAFGEDVESNTLGSEGVLVQMKVKEESDRIIHTSEEKQFIKYFEGATNDRRKKLRDSLKRRGVDAGLLNEMFPEIKLLHQNGNRAAKVLKGQPDVFANDQIEKAWRTFGLKENFTVTREITRHEGERMWLRSTWRDGSCLVRKVKGFGNEFGFALQFIDMDWLDLNYNVRRLENGNEVRMGKEYNSWKECVAYYIIVRSPGDWMWSTGVSGYSTGAAGRFARTRIDASEIVHGYLRERIDQSREVPWLVSAITRLHMLGKYEEAELVASLLSARKTGTWYSDLFSDNATLTKDFSMTERGEFEEATEPGQDTIAPFGWKYQVNDPKHPNTNVEQFRKVMLQGISAALPGASYHRISQDPSGLSFSNLRGIELQSRESWMMIQRFMQDNFHTEIFEPFLEAGLMSGKIPLPVSKFDKFNAPYWIFRRWKGIDPIKEAEANKLNLLLCNTTRTKIAAESGHDFEEIIEQLVLEEEMLEVAGLQSLSLGALGGTAPSDGNSASDEPDLKEEDGTNPKQKAEAYESGARSGLITPQEEDETSFRQRLGLPELSPEAKAKRAEKSRNPRPQKKRVKFLHDSSGKLVGAEAETLSVNGSKKMEFSQ
jgi:lambda family phage portal protein